MNEYRKPGIRRDRNILTVPDRAGEIAGIIVTILVAAFFVYHERADTGFMTSSFGMVEILLFYGSFALSIVSAGSRAAMGRRDAARPFELASNVFTAIAALWFLRVFPFNFAHLADPLPPFLRFILAWISNPIGWVIILLSAIASIATAAYNAVRIALDLI